MDAEEPSATSAVGYKRPPRSTRFQKGTSGNPRGRPKNRKRTLPYDHVLGQMVTVREDGKERRVTAAEAFLLHLTKRGLEGDGPSMRAFLGAMESVRQRQPHHEIDPITRIVFRGYGPGIVLSDLGMAIKRHGCDKARARWELKAWIVEAALERLAPKSLTLEQQREIWDNSLRPETIRWPEWWAYRGQ